MAIKGPAKSAVAAVPDAPSTALAKPMNDEAALAALLEAGLGADDVEDGMNEFSPNDFKTPLKMFNLKNKEAIDGTRVTQDMWFDSIEKTVSQELNFALLEVHKSNLYEVYSNKEDRNVQVCSSFDRITGTWQEDGHARPCENCPDKVWRTQPDGKRKPNCSEKWTAACYSAEENKVFAISFKRTSLDPIRNYLQAHHLSKRPLANGKRGNIPLFTYNVRATLEMHRSGNYALPVFERGAVWPAATLKQLHETSVAVRDTLQERLKSADESAAEGGDASFDTAAYDAEGGARGGKKFVDEK